MYSPLRVTSPHHVCTCEFWQSPEDSTFF